MTGLAAVPLESPESELAGGRDLVLGRYQLRERLGRGSLAEVYRATDVAGGRDVAVKIAADAGARQRDRIRNEARILGALDHRAIVGFVGEGIIPGGARAGRPFLIEELAFGASLSETLRSAEPHRADVAAWATDLYDGISHLHGVGLVHRDIKPANLMLSGLRRSPVRIVDFGIAALAGTLPEPGISSGTVHYMSPEQASGGPAHPSWDVYALGLVLLELLTGRKAYPGTAVESLVARTLRSPEIPHMLGRGWSELLGSATAMDGANRPTAAEAAGLASRLVPPGWPRRAQLLSRRSARGIPLTRPA